MILVTFKMSALKWPEEDFYCQQNGGRKSKWRGNKKC